MHNDTVIPPLDIKRGDRNTAYGRIETDIRQKIALGKWPAGEGIPSRRDLAKEYGVGLVTIQKAIQLLVADGTLEALDRRGTFVASTPGKTNGLRSRPATGDQTTLCVYEPQNVPSARINSRIAVLIPAFTTVETDRHELLRHAYSRIPYDLPAINWHDIVSRSLERAYSSWGGTVDVVYYEAKPNPAQSLNAKITEVCAAGANAVVLIGLLNVGDAVIDSMLNVFQSQSPVPIAMITWMEMTEPLPYVYYDQTYAGYAAAEHLITRGYEQIFFVRHFMYDWVEKRLAGAKAATRRFGLDPSAFLVSSGALVDDQQSFDPIRNYSAVRGSLEECLEVADAAVKKAGRLAIIAPNDLTAFVLYQAAEHLNLNPGHDFGLVGFDDLPISQPLGLTSIRPPLEDLGFETASLVHSMISGKQSRIQIRLTSHVMARASTRRPT